MYLSSESPQKQILPLTSHGPCALRQNPAFLPPDKQMQHTQTDTIEKAGPGSYYGAEQHGTECRPLWKLLAQLSQCLRQRVTSTSLIFCRFIKVEIYLFKVDLAARSTHTVTHKHTRNLLRHRSSCHGRSSQPRDNGALSAVLDLCVTQQLLLLNKIAPMLLLLLHISGPSSKTGTSAFLS